MKWILPSLAFMCFCISFLAHVGTYFGFNAGEAFPIIWILVLFLFLLWFLVFGKRARERNWNFFLVLPKWSHRLLKVFSLYAAINILLVTFGGSPLRLNGTYAIYQINEGQRIFVQANVAGENLERVELSGIPTLQTKEGEIRFFEEITEAEYYQYTIPIMRLVTLHWMVFFLFLTLFSWYPKPQNSG